jgi:DNA polymerase I-like protein with 3'-5' exonuclease and polymerase domains
MQTAKANKLHRPRPRGKQLLGGLDPKPRIATSIPQKLYALDTETTGLDFVHGCKPFFISTCDPDGNLAYWEWDVNPVTRNVGEIKEYIDSTSPLWEDDAVEESPWGDVFVTLPPKKDRAELQGLLTNNRFVLHNTKFDSHALESHGFPCINFDTVHDTLIASHVLCSNESHGLKDLALKYLDIRDDDEQELRNATNEARRIARQLGWAIADGPHDHFPTQKQAPKDGWWKLDTWLPRMVAKYKWEVEGDTSFAPQHDDNFWEGITAEGKEPHPWWTVLSRYALRDVERTYGLYWVFMEELDKQGLRSLYEERRQNLAAIYHMERHGVTLNGAKVEAVSEKLITESEELSAKCFDLAAKAPQPPKPKYSKAEWEQLTKKEKKEYNTPFTFDNLNSPKQMETLLFDCWKLKTTKRTGNGNRSTDSEVLVGLKERSTGDAKKFIESLAGFRKRDKALAYINEYNTRSVEESVVVTESTLHHTTVQAKIAAEFRPTKTHLILRLRGNFNITGTDTTRLSSSGPNFQNISKKEYEDENGVVVKDLNLRRMFGPPPGREWFSGDYSNIELRIFAWESGDQNLIDAFLEGYSVHLLFAELLYQPQWSKLQPKACEKLGKPYKDISPKELQRAIGKLFKTEYEATWYQWVKNGNFSLIYGAGKDKADRTYQRPGAYDLIRNRMPEIDHFLSQKYQEALVHGFVTCLGGYKLYVPVSEPHKAVNYFVQGTAGWFMCIALNKIHKYLADLNRKLGTPSDPQPYRMIMTIHDELVFDFPIHERNLEVIIHIARLMEQSGTPFGIPTPVQFDRHADNWADGERLELAL